MVKIALDNNKVQEAQAIYCILKWENYLQAAQLCKISNAGKRKGAYFAKKISENKIRSHINIFRLTARKLIFNQYV